MVRQLPHAAELRWNLPRNPFERRADPALRVGLRRQGMARAEAISALDRTTQLYLPERARRSPATWHPATAAARRRSRPGFKQATTYASRLSLVRAAYPHLRIRLAFARVAARISSLENCSCVNPSARCLPFRVLSPGGVRGAD